ncbi:MAG TPA: sulfotransferase domain-containing protein [Candidatus Limnocylindrales bacterium]|nr:sulfotransferase domain-containing protein [Candidatus Limnocylindrales bacterium]
MTIAHRGLLPNDVFLASYPRSGSVWLRFLLTEMLSGDASFVTISNTVPYVGKHGATPSLVPAGGRLIKTHEPFNSFYRRAIHLVRDPRDVCISYFNFLQRIGKITIRAGDDKAASFDHHVNAFLAGRVDAFGTWQQHLVSWSAAKEHGRADVHRIRFEDLKADTPAELERLADWLKLPFSRSDAVRVAERCSVENMKRAEAEGRLANPPVFSKTALRTGLSLILAGRAGGWREALTDAQQDRFAAFAEGLALMGYPPAGAGKPGAAARARMAVG